MSTQINPHKLLGPWTAGYALDHHTTSSTLVGYNADGREVFETSRTPIGELLYRLKNRGDDSSVQPLVDSLATFLKAWNIPVDAIVPVPPSNTRRQRQPVMLVAAGLSRATKLPLCGSCVSKVKSTGQLKDVFDYAKRIEMLGGAFSVDRVQTAGKRLLLFDDLFRSGATASTITRLLLDPGGAAAVYLLTLTRTRKLS